MPAPSGSDLVSPMPLPCGVLAFLGDWLAVWSSKNGMPAPSLASHGGCLVAKLLGCEGGIIGFGAGPYSLQRYLDQFWGCAHHHSDCPNQEALLGILPVKCWSLTGAGPTPSPAPQIRPAVGNATLLGFDSWGGAPRTRGWLTQTMGKRVGLLAQGLSLVFGGQSRSL